MTAVEHDHILDAFEDALSAAADELTDLRRPARDLGAQIAKFRTLTNWLFDGGWVRWGWPKDVGGLGGSSILRCEILESRTMELAAKLAAGAPLALRAVKFMMRRAMENALDTSLGDAQQAVLWVGPSADAKEGKAAFLQRRPPKFTGQ